MDSPTTPSSGSVKLVSAIPVREGMRDQFLEWNGRVADALLASPGFTSREVIPPQTEDIKEWVFITRFDSIEHLRAWRTSDDRNRLFEEMKPLLDGPFTAGCIARLSGRIFSTTKDFRRRLDDADALFQH